ELRVFENDGEDVLYVACENPAAWRSWHRATGGLPHQESAHEYTPHLTLAYLKPGKGKLYAGKRVLAGPPVPVATVVYSGPDGRDERAAVWPSADELEQAFSETVNLAWRASRSSTGNLKAEWDGEGGVQKKDQYGENARRALAGESLIAQRPDAQSPIAEKLPTAKTLPTAQAVPLPKVGPGQKLVKARDYRDGMEPPPAKKPVVATPKAPPRVVKPVSARPADKPTPVKAKPKVGNTPKPPVLPTQPKPSVPPVAKPPTPQPPAPKTPPDITPDQKKSPASDQSQLLKTAERKARKADLNDPMGAGRGVGIHLDSVPEEVGRQFDAHGASGIKNLTSLLNDGIDPNRTFYSATIASANNPTGTGMDLRADSDFVLFAKPGQTLRHSGIHGVLVSGHYAGSIPELQKAFPKVQFFAADQSASVLGKMAKPGGGTVDYRGGTTHPKPPVATKQPSPPSVTRP
ncbi:MAG: hypothetical protein VKJ09_15550, partial [Leptolyngbya sp.]|nr:hypothetical protein [Leptolyngbya sp.]